MLLVIVVSDWPWCFAVKSDQIFIVQIFDEFSIGAKVLLNYLVIYYCVLQAVPA
jgi:hypothetical protein